MDEQREVYTQIVVNTFKLMPHTIIPIEEFREAIWDGKGPPENWKATIYASISKAYRYFEENENKTIRNWPRQGWKLVDNEHEKLIVANKWRKRTEGWAKSTYRKTKIVNRDLLPEKSKSEFDKTIMILANTINIIKGLCSPLDALVEDLEPKDKERNEN